MRTIKTLFLCSAMLLFTIASKAQQSIEVFSTEGVTITIKVAGIDPANSQTYWTEIDNRSSNDIKISFNYSIKLKCGKYKNGRLSREISKGSSTDFGRYVGAFNAKNECNLTSGTAVETASVSSVVIENLALPKIRNAINNANAKIKSRDFAAAQKYIDEASNLCNYCELQQSINTAQENLREEKLAVEQENFEKEQQKIRVKEEEERKEKEKKEKEDEKKEQPKEEEKSSENQELTDETKPDVKNEIEEIKEIEESESTTLKEQKEKKKKTKEEEDREYKLYLYCLEQYNAVKDRIDAAKRARTVSSWVEADNAIKNYNCSHTVSLNSEWRKEVKNGIEAAAIAEGTVEVLGIFTGISWTYGYGQFLNSNNNSFIHRFVIGNSDVYDGKKVNLRPSIMLGFMRLPEQELNYRLDREYFFENEVITKTELMEDIKMMTIGIGPSLTFWPTKNIYLQVAPEINIGLDTSGESYPLKSFNVFPILNNKLGVRFGRFYLSGTYGMMWNKFKVEENEDYKPQYAVVDMVSGYWTVESVNANKWKLNSFWLVSLGVNIDM